MFKWINDKINLSYETYTTKEAHDIICLLKEKAKTHKWYSFLLPGQIDYKEFKFIDNKIEIMRMPNTFWPFRAFGKINFTFLESASTQTKIKCEIMTGNNLVPLIITIQSAFILLLAAPVIIMARDLDILTRFAVPIVALTVFDGIFILKVWSDKRSLIDYSHTIIKLIKG